MNQLRNTIKRLSSRKSAWIAAYLACGAVIVALATPLLGWRALNVLTPSMKPHINPGALVLVHRVPYANIQPGQVITYRDPHRSGVTITHRVVAKGIVGGAPTVTTKGDANALPDRPVPAGNVVGRVGAVVPGLGSVLGALRTPLGLLALVIVPGLLVIWAESRTLRRLLAGPARALRPSARRLHLDGLYRAPALALAAGIVAAATGATLAQVASTVHLTANMLTVGQASPSPSPTVSPTPSGSPSPSGGPCPNVSISNTGPNSTNTVTCTSTSSRSSSRSTSVSISNSSSQSTTTGSVNVHDNTSSGNVTGGSASNTSSSSFNISLP